MPGLAAGAIPAKVASGLSGWRPPLSPLPSASTPAAFSLELNVRRWHDYPSGGLLHEYQAHSWATPPQHKTPRTPAEHIHRGFAIDQDCCCVGPRQARVLQRAGARVITTFWKRIEDLEHQAYPVGTSSAPPPPQVVPSGAI